MRVFIVAVLIVTCIFTCGCTDRLVIYPYLAPDGYAPADCTEYTAPMRHAFHGHLLIFCRRDGEAPMTITAEAEALAPGGSAAAPSPFRSVFS